MLNSLVNPSLSVCFPNTKVHASSFSVISRELQHHIKHFQPLALQSQQPFEIPDPVSQLRFAPYGRKSKAKLGSCLPSMTTASHVDNKT